MGAGALNISATTAGSTADYPYCSSAQAASADVVYAFTLATAGTLTVTVTAASGSALLPNVDIRSDCTKPSLYCSPGSSSSTIVSQDLGAGTYYYIISGENCTSGTFTLSAQLTALLCGNGVLDPGEQCDPGMSPPANDGCGAPGTTSQCQFLPAPQSQDTCPGQAISISPGTSSNPVFFASNGLSTYGFKDDYTASASCRAASFATTGGLDRVFQLTPTTSGTMTVSVGYEADGITDACAADMTVPMCWARVLYARSTCASATTELACAVGLDASSDYVPATIQFPVTANTPYWVFVDGYDGNSYSYGPFNVPTARAPFFRARPIATTLLRHDEHGEEVVRARTRVASQWSDGGSVRRGESVPTVDAALLGEHAP